MGFQDCPRPNIVLRDGKIPSRMANRGDPCESATSTSDGHNFLFRTPIRTLDSTESSLSLQFNKIKCSIKPWAEHWAWSQTVKEWSVMVSGTSVFGIGLYME